MKITKEAVFAVVVISLLGLCGWLYYGNRHQPTNASRVYYNHDTQANEQIIGLIRDADKFIYFAVYTFTRSDIKDALLGAKYRGVEIRGLVDRDQTAGLPDQAKIVEQLRDAGIPVAIDHHAGIMHLKTIVTEKAYASGSYNWTASATTINDE